MFQMLGSRGTNASPSIVQLGDTIGTVIGWLSAYLVDQIGNKYGWYNLHIK